MAAVIFNGAFVKTLKDNIKIGILENIYLLTGDSDDPTVVAKDAPQGSIYWRSGTSEIWQKMDSGSSTNWSRMDGDISGTGSSTDNAVMRWNGTSGLSAQDSGVLIDDLNNMTGVNDITTVNDVNVGNDLDVTGNITVGGTVDGRDVSADGTTLDNHLNGAANKHDASEIDYERAGGSRVDIQAGSPDAESAITDLDDRKLSVNGANTMGADLDMGTNAITNVGNVDGRDVSADGSTLDAHLDGGASKHDLTEIDYERLDGNKKNIQAGSDNGESAITDLDDAIGSLVQGSEYTASNDAIVSSHLQGIDAQLGTLSTLVNTWEWQNSALDYITDNTAAPPTEVSGDRYVLSHDGGAPNAAWDGASAGDIVEFNGTTWDATTPTTGMMISIDDESTSLRQWSGSAWQQKFFESTTASGFLSITGFDVQLTNLSAQNLILGNGSNVATSVDLSTLGEINGTTAGGLVIKTGVVDNSKIDAAAAIEFSKMENLTANRALVSDASGDVSVSAATDTEVGHLSGVTSAIQTQLDAKLDDFTSTNDNRLVRTDGTTGEAVQESLVSLDDLGVMSGLTQLNADNLRLDGNTLSSTDTDGDIVLDPNGTGDIDASTSTIKNVVDPVDNQDAATKAYVDSAVAGFTVSSVSTNTNMVSDTTYLVDSTGGAVQMTLPTPAAGAFVRVKDSGGDANGFNITVARNGSENIDNVAANFTMDSNLEAKVFVSDGTDWFVL